MVQEDAMRILSWLGGVFCGFVAATVLSLGSVMLLYSIPARDAVIAKAPEVGRSAALAPTSLFVGRQDSSLFAEIENIEPVMAAQVPTGMQSEAVTVIRRIIGQAESSSAGYDAVQYHARIKPPRKLTQMTVAEIYDWIDATPRQPHAIGKYQFIPPTLRRVMVKAGSSPQDLFTPALQDRLAHVLLAGAGYHKIKAGELGRHQFMNNLAKIWAGLPNDTGRSHYHGYAGNKASITWDRFDAQMAKAFPL